MYIAKLYFSLIEGYQECLSPACCPQCVGEAVQKQITKYERFASMLREQPKTVTTVADYIRYPRK